MDTRLFYGSVRRAVLLYLFALLFPLNIHAEIGVDWTQLLADQPSTGGTSLEAHETAVLDGTLYIVDHFSVHRLINASRYETILLDPPFRHDFVMRDGFSLDALNGKLWLIQTKQGDNAYNEIWSSPDGVNWTLEVEYAPFFGRAYHTTAVHNGRLFLLGGRTATGKALHDIWSTADGINWEISNHSPPFSKRYDAALESHDGRLWLMGGENASGDKLYDLWYSTDGHGWNVTTGGFVIPYPRGKHEMTSFNGKLWMTGGETDIIASNALHDAWSVLGTDGENPVWNPEVSVPGLSSRHGLEVLDNQLVVIEEGASQIWTSTDGTSWNYQNPAERPDSSTESEMVFYENQLWWFVHSPTTYENEVWTSTNGTDWTFVSNTVPGRVTQAIVFNDEIFVVYFPGNNIFSSKDGITWTGRGSALGVWSDPFPHYIGAAPRLAVLGDSLYYIYAPDLVYKVEGGAYTTVIAGSDSTDFINRPVATFQDKLWTITNDGIFSLSEGTTFTQVGTTPTELMNRTDYEFLVADGRMWVLGGVKDNSTPLTDVLVSPDGMNWTTVNMDAPFGIRLYPGSVSTGDSIYIFGGSGLNAMNGEFLNDVWVTNTSQNRITVEDWMSVE